MGSAFGLSPVRSCREQRPQKAMAKIHFNIIAAASGENAIVQALSDAIDQLKAQVEAAGGEWRGCGVDVTRDPVAEVPVVIDVTPPDAPQPDPIVKVKRKGRA